MALPGTKSPPRDMAKKGSETDLPQAQGSKIIKDDMLRMGQASDIGKAPTSRIYTRDYSKKGRDAGDVDLITAALGNPLGR